MSTLTVLGAASMAFVLAFTWHKASGPQAAAGGQSRRDSIREAWVNLAIGFGINFVANIFLLPLMTEGATLSAANNWWGGWIYTSLSIVRQYAIRRWFNAR